MTAEKHISDRQMPSELELLSQIKDVVSKFNDGDDKIATIADVVDEVERIISEHEKEIGGATVNNKIIKVIGKFRKDQAYDNKLSGRGDMEAAGDKFMNAIEKYISDSVNFII